MFTEALTPHAFTGSDTEHSLTLQNMEVKHLLSLFSHLWVD